MFSVEKGNDAQQEQDQPCEDTIFFQFILGEVDAFIGIFSQFAQSNAVVFSFFYKKVLLFYFLFLSIHYFRQLG